MQDHCWLNRRFEAAERPEIVCLCGSTRFKDEFLLHTARLTREGKIVLSVGMFTHTDLGGHAERVLGQQVKDQLDELHKRKIDLADEIFVINPSGYVGSSTRSEIEYARKHGKPISSIALLEGL